MKRLSSMSVLTIRLFPLLLLIGLAGCSSPDQKLEKWQSPSVNYLRERLEANPEDAGALQASGYSASHIYDVNTVNTCYRKAIALNPKSQWYRISYGWALFNAGAFKQARDQWLDANAFCKGKHPQNLITVSLGYYGTGEYRQAAEFYNRQVQQDSRYGSFESLQAATARWTWREKTALYDLFDIWRYTYEN
jgi:tetratricopeptide (TPR) repeat protein